MPEPAERLIVSDTGPIISLEKLSDGFRFIRLLYDRILIPKAVLDELVEGQFEDEEAYIDHYEVDDLFVVRTVSSPIEHLTPTVSLDAGEWNAILLARETGHPLLIEEEAGRRVARDLGISIGGTAGLVLRAVRERMISRAEGKERLWELRRAGRINVRIHQAIEEAIENATR